MDLGLGIAGAAGAGLFTVGAALSFKEGFLVLGIGQGIGTVVTTAAVMQRVRKIKATLVNRL